MTSNLTFTLFCITWGILCIQNLINDDIKGIRIHSFVTLSTTILSYFLLNLIIK